MKARGFCDIVRSTARFSFFRHWLFLCLGKGCLVTVTILGYFLITFKEGNSISYNIAYGSSENADSEFSLFAWGRSCSLASHGVPCEDSAQTTRMGRLIWVILGPTCNFFESAVPRPSCYTTPLVSAHQIYEYKLTQFGLNKLLLYYILEESNFHLRYTRPCDLDGPKGKWLNYWQTVETLIRRRVLRRLIWVSTICQIPF